MDRCAVLVDAGYLMGAAATLLDPPGLRSSVTADWAPMMKSIVELAAEQTGLPVLRVLWYDAWYDGRPAPEHLVLGSLPDVKVRLGVLVRHGQRMEQKGVDSFLHRDMTALARNKAVADIVLISGDEDIRRGVDEVQDFGVKVHLWGVEAGAPQFNQARSLITEADRRFVLSEEWVKQYVKTKPRYVGPPPPPKSADGTTPQDPLLHDPTTKDPTTQPVPGGADQRDVEPVAPGHAAASAVTGATVATAETVAASNGRATPVGGAVPSSDAPTPDSSTSGAVVPSPRTQPAPVPVSEAERTPTVTSAAQPPADTPTADAPAPSPVVPKPGPKPAPPKGATPPAATSTPAMPPAPRLPVPQFMTLAELSTERQKWRDNEEDSTSMLALPYDVGRRYGARWASRATPALLARSRTVKPELPEMITKEVFKFASDRGFDAYNDDEVRVAVLDGVWRAIDDIARR